MPLLLTIEFAHFSFFKTFVILISNSLCTFIKDELSNVLVSHLKYTLVICWLEKDDLLVNAFTELEHKAAKKIGVA